MKIMITLIFWCGVAILILINALLTNHKIKISLLLKTVPLKYENRVRDVLGIEASRESRSLQMGGVKSGARASV